MTARLRSKRFIPTVALGVGMVLGVTGCTFLVAQGAPMPYSRSGVGVNVEGVGPLAVRNVMIVASDDGDEGVLIAAIVNDTATTHVLRVEVGAGSASGLTIPVPAETTVSFGQRDSLKDPPMIDELGAEPGSMVPIYFQAGSAPGTLMNVPVLDGCLGYLEGLEPGPRPDDCPMNEPLALGWISTASGVAA